MPMNDSIRRPAAAIPQQPTDRTAAMAAGPVLATAGAVIATAAATALALLLLPDAAGRPAAVFPLVALAGAAAHLPLVAALRRSLLRPLRGLREAATRRRDPGDTDVSLPAGAHPDLLGVADGLQRVLAEAAGDRRRLREVAARAIRAQETERIRVARQLQEETAQTLAALLYHLRAARMTADEAARDGILEALGTELSEVTDTVRRFARGLHPPALEELGVGPAVEAYAAALTERGGPVITVAADNVRPVLGRERELSLFRIVQEAVGNAVRHAGASSIHVAIVARDGGVTATVLDDGRGFDLARMEERHPCLGLFGLRERALYAGGTARIASAPDRGTTVEVEFPASPAASPAAWPVILPSAARA
jgi:two-component system, NarL family, sensor histidine kinase UhpB